MITSDLGLSSRLYARSSGPIGVLVANGRVADPSIALATDLWSKFVDFLEGDSGAFRASAYADEVYLCVLARLLAANVLAERAILSDSPELTAILGGPYFRGHYQLENMVELDYFGWLFSPARISVLLPVAREIQRDLYAYDFRARPEEDLFGQLMAQLARRSQRKLLGQEWTPAWLASLVAGRCLDGLPEGEAPRIVDMCCGSGSIIAEVLKATRNRYGLTTIDDLQDVATGFDIDPLAVGLAKTTWVVALAAEIKAATSPIVIPIYHADSLFAAAPVSAVLPLLGEDDPIPVALDGTVIRLPHALVNPTYRDLFDRIVDGAYDEARAAQAKGKAEHLTADIAREFVKGAASISGVPLPEKLEADLGTAVLALTQRMAELAVANRNGIWAFILRNTYRPGLLSGQFNGLATHLGLR
ncbi:MAG TPA: N-6 DNA methylase [Stellaceae bacterium]|nr:N-6 DNA methylase [Stellaceae bacterium]